jgi:hypothetical protein
MTCAMAHMCSWQIVYSDILVELTHSRTSESIQHYSALTRFVRATPGHLASRNTSWAPGASWCGHMWPRPLEVQMASSGPGPLLCKALPQSMMLLLLDREFRVVLQHRLGMSTMPANGVEQECWCMTIWQIYPGPVRHRGTPRAQCKCWWS